MKEYEQHRNTILKVITAREAPPRPQQCTICCSTYAWNLMKWRCEDCFGRPVFCSGCLRDTHNLQPFHRVSRWDGTCFSRSSLEKAGVTLNLGHCGKLCPRYRPLAPMVPSIAPSAGHTFLSNRAGTSAAGAGNRHSPESGSNNRTAYELDNGTVTELGIDLLSFTSHASVGGEPPFGPHQSQSGTTSNELLNEIPTSTQQTDEDELPPLQQDVARERSTSHVAQPAPAPAPALNRAPVIEDLFDWRSALSPTGSPPPEFQTDPLNEMEKENHLHTFFAEESEDEDSWRSTETGGVPLRTRLPKRTDDKYDCPIITVVDITGIHEIRTRFCRCGPLENNPLSHQLLNMGLFPSSMKRTRTVFTFRLLEDFHLSNMEGKVSAFKYYSKLQRLTSNAFPSMVTDRYRELLRALRQWRDIRARQRAGVPFEPEDSEIPLGGLGLFCAACPQPDVNLPQDWMADSNR